MGPQHLPIAAVFLAVSVLALSGCSIGPKYKIPTAPTPPAYKEMGNWKIAQPNDQNLGGNWWEMFRDSNLNTLEQQVEVSNQNLKAAFAQYQEARALVRYYRADCRVGGGASGCPGAGHRPPLKPCMRVSRTRLSRRLKS